MTRTEVHLRLAWWSIATHCNTEAVLGNLERKIKVKSGANITPWRLSSRSLARLADVSCVKAPEQFHWDFSSLFPCCLSPLSSPVCARIQEVSTKCCSTYIYITVYLYIYILFVYVYIYIYCIYIYIYTLCMYVYIYIYKYILYIYMYIYTDCAYIYNYIYTVYVYVCVYIYILCMCIYIYVYTVHNIYIYTVYVYIYIYIYCVCVYIRIYLITHKNSKKLLVFHRQPTSGR